eukprot:comp16716_c0_seq1/m.14993 comp16716_c0_seq1/g.14993  ORF comp16716_c0_seq1/g.14993 comp16716_c0_seq1/m.14993 type:complete len:734 (+) comp16716_c0_seq1:240-2441(+)
MHSHDKKKKKRFLLHLFHSLGAPGHNLGGPADGVGHVELTQVVDRGLEGGLGRAGRFAGKLLRNTDEVGALNGVHAQQVGGNLAHAGAQGIQAVVGQLVAGNLRQRTDDLPVLTCLLRRRDGRLCSLHTALRVDVGGVLFRVCGTGQNDVGHVRTLVTVVALVDDGGVGAHVVLCHVTLISPDQVQHLGLLGWHPGLVAKIKCAHLPGNPVQDVEWVPCGVTGLGLSSQVGQQAEDGCTVGPLNGRAANDDHGLLGLAEHVAPWVGAIEQGGDNRCVAAQGLSAIVEVVHTANDTHTELVVDVGLADLAVEHGRLEAGVSADQQQHVSLLDTGQTAIEQVVGPQITACTSQSNGLLSVQGVRVVAVQKVLKGSGCLHIDLPTNHTNDLLTLCSLKAGGSLQKGLLPGHLVELAVLFEHGEGQALPLQAIVGKAGLVRDPLLVDVLVQAGHDAHNLTTTGIDPDVASSSIENIDGLRLAQLPWAGSESIGLGREGTHGAQVDDVARHLRLEHLLDVRADLHVVATASGAQVLHAGHLVGKAHTTRALDAAGHLHLDKGTNVLVLNSALACKVHVGEAAAVAAEHKGLVLQVALATLVAHGAVQRVVDQKELHNSLAGLLCDGRVCLDLHVGHHGHGARGHGLGGFLHLDQAHAAVTRNRQPVMVAETRNIHTGGLACLQHGGGSIHRDLNSIHSHLHRFWGGRLVQHRSTGVEQALGYGGPPIALDDRGCAEHG